MPQLFDDLPAVTGDPFADLPGSAPAPASFDDLPDSPETIVSRIDSDPYHNPTREEFAAYREAKAKQPSKPWEAFKGGAAHVAKSAVDLAKGLVSEGLVKTPEDVGNRLQTVGEALTRGTMDLGTVGRSIVDRFSSIYQDTDEAQFIAQKTDALNRQAFPGGYTPTTEWFTPTTVPEPLRKQWKAEYKEYKLDRDYQRFQINREIGQVRETARRGQGDILPALTGAAEQAVAEPLSQFADASDVATLAAGALAAKVLQPAGRAAGSTAARIAGRGAEATGEAITSAAKLPEKTVARGIEALTGSAEAGVKAGKVLAGGEAGLAVAGVGGLTVPGVTQVAQAVLAAKGAGGAVKSAGQAASAVGRAAATPSRFGMLLRISKDGAAPEWLRRAAGNAAVLDPALRAAADFTGDVTRGAVGGALVGGSLGLIAGGDLDSAAAGAGGGAALGAAGGAGRFLTGGPARNAQRRTADIAQFLARRSPEEIAALSNLKLNEGQMLRTADIERLGLGVINAEGRGDLRLRFLTPDQFKELHPDQSQARGAVPFESTEIHINTGYRGPRSIFHEIGHALDNLDFGSAQRQRLNERLFDRVAEDGTVLSRGLYDSQDLLDFTRQYAQRLGKTPEELAADVASSGRDLRSYMQGEMRAEALANFMEGNPNLPANRGITRRAADAVLLAEADTFLGRIRRGLESAGITFRADGTPSDLFVKDGRPVTNNPEVNAALRDYLRAKQRITQPLLTADAESSAPAIRPEDFTRPGGRRLVEIYKDWDGFRRDADGNPIISGNEKQLAAAQQAEATSRAQSEAAAKAAMDADAATAAAQLKLEQLNQEVARREAMAKLTEDRVSAAEARTAAARAKAAAAEVRSAEARAKNARALAEARVNEAAKRQAAFLALKENSGRPELLSEREIQRLQLKRVELMIEALRQVPDLGESGAVREKDNGAWEGTHFSEAQMRALETLPRDLMPPSLLEKIRNVNTSMASGDGATLILDYNAALKGKRYSSGISPSVRKAAPFTFNLSKAGNFYITTIDVTHVARKLSDWQKNKTGRLAPWDGDLAAMTADLRTYLDNAAHGRPGALDLDRDASRAIAKRDVLNDFFNIPAGDSVANPAKISGKTDKDVLIRSRRLDRINRVTPGDNPFPFNLTSYGRMKENLLPPANATAFDKGLDARVVNHQSRIQSSHDFARRLPGVPESTALDLADYHFSKGGSPESLRAINPESIQRAIKTGGTDGAKAVLKPK